MPEPVDWYREERRGCWLRVVIVLLIAGVLGGWLRLRWLSDSVQRIVMPARALLDHRYGESLRINPNWLLFRAEGVYLRGGPINHPLEITTRRPYQKRFAWEQYWRLDPVGSDKLQVRWYVSSRWDGNPEHSSVRVFGRTQLAALNAGKGLCLCRLGDDASDIGMVNPYFASVSLWMHPLFSGAKESSYNQWEQRVRSQNLGESTSGSAKLSRPVFILYRH